jgi:hypothetical protein
MLLLWRVRGAYDLVRVELRSDLICSHRRNLKDLVAGCFISSSYFLVHKFGCRMSVVRP